MNKNKKIALIAGAVVLITIVSVILISYFTNSYIKYAAAYKKLFNSGSLECNFTAETDVDSKSFKSSGNMKIKQNDKGQMMFLLDVTSDDSKLTEFTDGKYIYNDVNGEKTKLKIGEKSTVLQQDQSSNEKFDIDLYEQKLSSFLEAGKIKDLKLIDIVDSKYIKKIQSKTISTGKQYTITFADELSSSLSSVFEDVQTNNNNSEKAKINIKTIKCTFNENSSGVLSGANYAISFDTVLPSGLTGEDKDKTLPVKINIKMTFVNPGSAVDFSLPSTDGYQ